MTPAARIYGASGPACVVAAAYRPGGWVEPGARARIARCAREGYAIARAEREGTGPCRTLPEPPYPGRNRPDRRRLALHDLAERHALDGVPFSPWPSWTLAGWRERRASTDAARRRRSLDAGCYVADLDARRGVAA